MVTRDETPKASPGGLVYAATARPWSYAASVLLVAILYYTAAKFGLRLALVGRNITEPNGSGQNLNTEESMLKRACWSSVDVSTNESAGTTVPAPGSFRSSGRVESPIAETRCDLSAQRK